MASEGFRTNHGVTKGSDIVEKMNEACKRKRDKTKNGKSVDKVLEKGFDGKLLLDSLIKYEDLYAKTSSQGVTFSDYVNAIEFVTYVVGGLSYSQAFAKTFPERNSESHKKYLSSYASQYANGNLVSNMLGRVYINQHIFFIDKTISAKLKLYDMGFDEKVNYRDRVNALDKFLTHTKKDEEKASNVLNNYTINNSSINIVNAVDEKLAKLANMAQQKIEDGTINAKDVAESNIKFLEEDPDE